MHVRGIAWGAVVLLAAASVGCSAARIRRLEPDTVTDLSGRWNDTDSRLVAEAMIADCLEASWLQRWQEANEDRPPRVIVGRVTNASHEHIDEAPFLKDLERALLASGRVAFVADAGEREGIRRERADQSRFSSEESFSGFGLESAADFMLLGRISSFEEAQGGRRVKAYQVNLELVSIATNEKVWIGEKEIKKQISRSRFGL